MSSTPLLGILLVLSGLVVLLSAEAALHARALRTFRVRIQVNGTRGKSSVTRLIAAGLRAGGIRTVAKTTGTLPRLIHPDGHEEAVPRFGRANVGEQIGVMRRARELGAEAVVIECMALQPFLQWISTARLVRPTHGVITNVRADHLDVMGPDVLGVAQALASSTPLGGTMFLGDGRYRGVFQEACIDRGSRLVGLPPEAVSRVHEAGDLRGFTYIEHAENVALALLVCESLGVDPQIALLGMQAAHPDPGALTRVTARRGGKEICFVNALAANDPESTGLLWKMALETASVGVTKVAMVNCRLDRVDRSRQLGEALAKLPLSDHYVLVGSGTQFFVQAATRSGLHPSRFLVAESLDERALLDRLFELANPSAVVVGMGNIGGVGLSLVDHLCELRNVPRVSLAPREGSRIPTLPERTATSQLEAPTLEAPPPPSLGPGA